MSYIQLQSDDALDYLDDHLKIEGESRAIFLQLNLVKELFPLLTYFLKMPKDGKCNERGRGFILVDHFD